MIYKAILQNPEVALTAIEMIRNAKHLFSREELDNFEYIADTTRRTGKCPSLDYFCQERDLEIRKCREITESEVVDIVLNEIEERTNLVKSNRLMELANGITKSGITDDVYQQIRELTEVRSDNSYEDPFDTAALKYDSLKERSAGLVTGVRAIDEKIGGMNPGSFNTIFAYVANFKTTWATNIAYKNSWDLGYNIVYFSLEVASENLMWNILSRHSFKTHLDKFPFIPHERIRFGSLSEKEDKFLKEEVIPDFRNNGKGKLYIVDESDLNDHTFLGLERKMRELDEKCKKDTGHGIDAVVIDQANLFKFSTSKSGIAMSSENSVVNAYSSFFRQQAVSFLGSKRKICVVMLAQANREGYKRAQKNEGRYDLRSIAEANELERASWRVFSAYSTESMKEAKECKVQILKNRSGLTMEDPVVIYVEPECCVFGDDVQGFNQIVDVDDFTDLFGE